MNQELESDLTSFGGHLKCERCGHIEKLGDVGYNLKHGWPTCHGLTMTWYTQKQLDKEVAICE